MKSLKEQSCIEIIKHQNISLHDFFIIINHPTNAEENLLAEACSDQHSEVWKFLIDRDYTPTLLLSRMDIFPKDYYEFARRLAQDIMFYYIIVGNWNFFVERIERGPLLVGRDENFEAEAEDDTTVIKFRILGSQPKLGSIGYVVQFYFDDPIKVSMSMPQAFILGPGHAPEDVAELYLRMKLYLAAQFKRIMMLYLMDHVDPITGEFRHLFQDLPLSRLPNNDAIEHVFDQELRNVTDMSRFHVDYLKFKEYIITVTDRNNNEKKYLTMFIDVGQLYFE